MTANTQVVLQEYENAPETPIVENKKDKVLKVDLDPKDFATIEEFNDAVRQRATEMGANDKNWPATVKVI